MAVAVAAMIVAYRWVVPATSAASAVPVVRIAHTMVYDRARAAFDEVIREYEALKVREGDPVRIEQIVIPAVIEKQWIRTRLIGGTPPDIVQQDPMATDAHFISRYFHALAGELEESNPYNVGTVLEGVTWRNTFYDSLEHSGFDFRLSQNYGIPLSGLTIRLVINLDLWETFTSAAGRDAELPADYESFLRACELAVQQRDPTGRPFLALAGSKPTTWELFTRLHRHQTQRLALRDNSLGELWFENQNLRINILAGQSPFPTEDERSAYGLIREVGQHLAPGALSLQRNDAFFQFAQGRALMAIVSSMDAPALKAMVKERFRMTAFALPMPGPDHPVFGPFALGPESERQFPGSGTFMLVRQDSLRTARAVDFLRFLTSLPRAQLFSDWTGMLSATVGVEPSAAVAPYMPQLEGYPPALNLDGTSNQRRIIENELHRLLARDGSVEAYVEAVRPQLLAQFPADQRNREGHNFVLQAQDALQAAAFFGAAPPETDAGARLEELVDVNLWYDFETLYFRGRFEEILRPLPAAAPQP